MQQEMTMNLNDIADELLILNKHTIDTLFSLDNCADCVALYIFFYKTAKWQKTNSIKATEDYIKKCLGWGYDKIRKAKNTLKEKGLIQIVQNRKDKKIEGWYIQVSYLVSQNSTDKIIVINNTQKQEVGNPTSRNQEVNALKYNNICLNNIDNMLENNNINNISKEKENIKENDDYSGREIIPPKKVEELTKGANALNIFHHWNESNIIQHRELTNDIRKQIDKVLKEYSVEQIKIAISHYAEALHSDYEYCSYKWSLEKFLKQDNCLKDFLDDGSKWINYLEYKNKKAYSNKKELSKETSYPDYKDKNYL